MKTRIGIFWLAIIDPTQQLALPSLTQATLQLGKGAEEIGAATPTVPGYLTKPHERSRSWPLNDPLSAYAFIGSTAHTRRRMSSAK